MPNANSEHFLVSLGDIIIGGFIFFIFCISWSFYNKHICTTWKNNNLHGHPLYKYLLQAGLGGRMAKEHWTPGGRPAASLPQLQLLPACIREKRKGESTCNACWCNANSRPGTTARITEQKSPATISVFSANFMETNFFRHPRMWKPLHPESLAEQESITRNRVWFIYYIKSIKGKLTCRGTTEQTQVHSKGPSRWPLL